jgi:hypothetical protein
LGSQNCAFMYSFLVVLKLWSQTCKANNWHSSVSL